MSGTSNRKLMDRAFDMLAEQNIKHSRLYEDAARPKPDISSPMDIRELATKPGKPREGAGYARKHVAA